MTSGVAAQIQRGEIANAIPLVVMVITAPSP
jgi:hypothetical protein